MICQSNDYMFHVSSILVMFVGTLVNHVGALTTTTFDLGPTHKIVMSSWLVTSVILNLWTLLS